MTLERMFAVLTPLETQIVRSIHLDGMTIVDLAKHLGYSRRHVTRLHRAAMSRLRGHGAASSRCKSTPGTTATVTTLFPHRGLYDGS